jgi:hypothetical protein
VGTKYTSIQQVWCRYNILTEIYERTVATKRTALRQHLGEGHETNTSRTPIIESSVKPVPIPQ